jgi:hypothetical protein
MRPQEPPFVISPTPPSKITLGLELEFALNATHSTIYTEWPWLNELCRIYDDLGPTFQLGLDGGGLAHELRMKPVAWTELYSRMPALHERLVKIHQFMPSLLVPVDGRTACAMHIHVSPYPKANALMTSLSDYSPFVLPEGFAPYGGKSWPTSHRTYEFRNMLSTLNWYTVYLRMQSIGRLIYHTLNHGEPPCLTL